ncbi:hypothetical protein [Gryllotalpicola ginsengisoli]|uniref:hypothetical protein n=1 Tax=Gryllotalpicola ginsengisoli TaxID=444608 RepID=UPI0003B39B17|nr:hypothetical protein [Gryllotalpicola ginsengisoli]
MAAGTDIDYWAPIAKEDRLAWSEALLRHPPIAIPNGVVGAGISTVHRNGKYHRNATWAAYAVELAAAGFRPDEFAKLSEAIRDLREQLSRLRPDMISRIPDGARTAYRLNPARWTSWLRALRQGLTPADALVAERIWVVAEEVRPARSVG